MSERSRSMENMDELNCKIVRQSLWGYPARPETGGPGDWITSHLSVCRDCDQHFGDVKALRAGLKNLPVRHAPSMLTIRLQVLASRERARNITHRDFGTWLTYRISRARLFFDNLLKPFAVPAAGGILASFLCFGIIVDNLHYA